MGCSWINFVINDDLVFKIKTICKFLLNPTPKSHRLFLVIRKVIKFGDENWGPFIKIKDEIKFKSFFWGEIST